MTTFNFLVVFLKSSEINKKVAFDEQLFVTLLKLRLDVPFEMLAQMKGISQSSMSEIFWKWVSLINSKLGFLIKWPDREVMRATLPGPFKAKFPRPSNFYI